MYYRFLAFIFLLVSFSSTQAEPLAIVPPDPVKRITIQPRLITGLSHFKYSDLQSSLLFEEESLFKEDSLSENNNFPISDNVMLYGIGGQINYSPLFLDIYVLETDKGTSNQFVQDQNNRVNIEFKKRDYAITLGANILDISNKLKVIDNFSIFTGYKKGITDTNTIQAFYINSDQNLALITETQTEYTVYGYFIGFGAGVETKYGSISLSLSYAWLRGNHDFSVARLDEATTKFNSSFGVYSAGSGRLQAWKIALGWGIPLSSNWSIHLLTEYQSYSTLKYSNAIEVDSEPLIDQVYNLQQEKLLQAKLSFIYTFDIF